MTFATLTFFVFLAVVFPAYWLLRRRGQNVLLIGASYTFYGWWDYRFCSLLLASSLLDYAVGLGLRSARAPGWRKLLLALSCTGNLGLLGVFKYHNFFIENLHVLLESAGWSAHVPTLQLILPVGISFYTFQTLSYVIDVYRGKLPATRNLVDYLAYVAFFPQLVAGPIERAPRLLPQFQQSRTFDYPRAVDGGRLILWGLFKKIVLADNLARFVDVCYADPAAYDGRHLALATVFFAFQIYCDFSAYSDIAIGAAKLFGIELMRNFAFPYFSQSPAEFWRRWHISLSTWFRDYLFLPLGGSRAGRWRTAVNVLATFTISGFWHGAGWTFVLWGFLNGVGVLPGLVFGRAQADGKLRATDLPGGSGWLPRPVAAGRMLGTFAFICLTWIFFRAESLGDALLIVQRCTLGLLQHVPTLSFGTLCGTTMLAVICLFLLLEWCTRRCHHPLALARWPLPARWTLYSLLLWTSFYFTGIDGGGQFIYFQF